MADGLKEALQAALDFEQRGHDFYAATAEKARNPLTREVFSGLAGQELVHMERIQEVYENLDFTGVARSPQTGNMERFIRGVFDRFAKQDRDTWSIDNAEA